LELIISTIPFMKIPTLTYWAMSSYIFSETDSEMIQMGLEPQTLREKQMILISSFINQMFVRHHKIEAERELNKISTII